MLCSGDVLDNRYRLTGPIATGGMGEVWRAMDMSLGRMVAVKLLRPDLLADLEFDARFQAEARTMAALTHPNVVNVYAYGHAPPTSGGAPYLVMPYVHGVPLSQRIAEAGRLSVAETGSVLIQAAAALHAAHRGGIVHCDVKPANMLVATDGGVTLVDFGVARPATVTTGSTGRTVIGTALYMAPEQVTGRPVSPATDIYALGAVAYHCLSGQPPFTGDTPLEITLRHLSDEPAPLPLDVPAALRMLVARALSKDPAQRHPSAAAFARAVRQAMVHPDATQSPVADLSPLRDPQGQPRWTAGRMAAVATLLVGGAVTLLLGSALPASTSPVDRAVTSVPSASAVAVPSDDAAPIVATSPTTTVATIGTTPTPPPAVAAPAGRVPASVAPSETNESSPQPTTTTGPSGQPTQSPPSATTSPSPELNPTPSEVSPSTAPSGAPRSS